MTLNFIGKYQLQQILVFYGRVGDGLQDLPLFINRFIPVVHKIRLFFLETSHTFFQQQGVDFIIRINHKNVIAMRFVNARVSGSRNTLIGLVNEVHSIIFFRPCVTFHPGIVGRTVIDKDDLEVRIGLGYYAFEAFIQIIRDIIRGYNDAYQGWVLICHTSFLNSHI